MSQFQKDSMLRNQLYSQIFTQTEAISEILGAYLQYDKGVSETLLAAENVHLIRRFNILDHKLEKTFEIL